MTASPTARRATLAGIVLLAVVVRLAGVGDRLSIDEGYSWIVGSASGAGAFLDRSDFVILKQFGVGLAIAVLIDATIVRLVLLPASMRLLGLTTWWLSDWLDDKLPVLDVEGSEYAHEAESMRPHAAPA